MRLDIVLNLCVHFMLFVQNRIMMALWTTDVKQLTVLQAKHILECISINID
jgi:hypothetical protein